MLERDSGTSQRSEHWVDGSGALRKEYHLGEDVGAAEQPYTNQWTEKDDS